MAYRNQNFMVTNIQIQKDYGYTDFSDQFRKIIIHHKRIGYDLSLHSY